MLLEKLLQIGQEEQSEIEQVHGVHVLQSDGYILFQFIVNLLYMI